MPLLTIALLPTTEPVAGPDLNGENPRDYVYASDCVSSLAESTPKTAETAILAVLTEAVQNVTLDSHDAQIESVAASAHMTAVAWTQDGGVYVRNSWGKGGFEIARVDDSANPDVAISGVSRLHLVYEKQGAIYYRASDGSSHPADDISLIFGILGTGPQIEVDLSNWARIVHMSLGGPQHIIHMGADNWFPVPLPAANGFSLVATCEFLQFLLITDSDVQLHSMYLAVNPVYQCVQRAVWPIEGDLQGPAHFAFSKPAGVINYHDDNGAVPYWMAVSWVERFAGAVLPVTDTLIPVYEMVNPLYPDQLANPDQIADGMNAVGWHGDNNPCNAGLLQTIAVTSTPLCVQAQVKRIASDNAAAQVRIGIDPGGGSGLFSTGVVWSSPLDNPGEFTTINLETAVSGNPATLFLRATQDALCANAVAVWDHVEVTTSGAVIRNASFEGAFNPQGVVIIPEGWTAFYDKSSTSDATVQITYRVYAGWLPDRGLTLSDKQDITENREMTTGVTGALRPDSIAFSHICESGDPLVGTALQCYGRRYFTCCAAGATDRTDAPGDPVFPRDLIRPANNLAARQDHASNGQMVLVWDMLQADHERKDIAVFDRLIAAACPKGKVIPIRSTAARQSDLDLFGPPTPSDGGNARIGALCRRRFVGDQKRTSGDARDAALPLHPDPSRKTVVEAPEEGTMFEGVYE